MVISEFCHVLVKPAQCCPLLDRIFNNDLYCCPSSSCGEDMEASDCDGEDDIVPPSKVTLGSSELDDLRLCILIG